MDERLQKQLDFALEIDKEKNIFRQTHLSGHGRNENDAEHAWHMAIMAYLLREYSNEPVDIGRVMLMCLIHDIVEIDAIKALSDADQIVVACGGGGIPVLMQDNNLKGASAVIEKDLAAGKLAELLDADMLVILTSVDNVCLNYGTENEKPLSTMTVAEAKQYMEEGQFGEDDMLPKIQAAIDFIGDSAIRSVLITKLNKDGTYVSGGPGTMITK